MVFLDEGWTMSMRQWLIVMMVAVAGIAEADRHAKLEVEVVPGLHTRDVPRNIEVRESGGVISVHGNIFKSPADFSRRTTGRVYVTVLDTEGETVGEYHADLLRATSGRHSSIAKFKVELTDLSEDAKTLQLRYGKARSKDEAPAKE